MPLSPVQQKRIQGFNAITDRMIANYQEHVNNLSYSLASRQAAQLLHDLCQEQKKFFSLCEEAEANGDETLLDFYAEEFRRTTEQIHELGHDHVALLRGPAEFSRSGLGP